MPRKQRNDNRQQRLLERLAREHDKTPSEVAVTTGATKQWRHVDSSAPHPLKVAAKKEDFLQHTAPLEATLPPGTPGGRMTSDEFVGELINEGLTRDQALQAVEATLLTLVERIDDETLRRLQADIPLDLRDFADPLTRGTVLPEAFDSVEFIARAALRAGIDPKVARYWTLAVFTALHKCISRETEGRLVRQLTDDYADMWPRPRDHT
jgi:uncharacterized protein (DUF2267 family)